MRCSLGALVVAVLTIGVVPAIAQKRIADQREFDLFQQASTEPEPLKRLDALKEWESSYPNSEFRRERLLFFAVAYKDSGRAAKSLESATQMLQLDPKDIQALI